METEANENKIKIMSFEEMKEACLKDSHLCLSYVDEAWTLSIDADEIVGCEKED